MVLNQPSAIQRDALVNHDTSFINYDTSYRVQRQLVGVIHGSKSPGGAAASLILLDFRFSPLKISRRIKSAEITVHFTASPHENRPGPKVIAIAPEGVFARRSLVYDTSTSSVRGISLGATIGGVDSSFGYQKEIVREVSDGSLTGHTVARGRNHGLPNTAIWTARESQIILAGIPSLIRTAVMVERMDDEVFFGSINVKTEVAGFSFRDAQARMLQSGQADLIKFDPRHPPIGTDIWQSNSNILDNLDQLEQADIASLVSDVLNNPTFTTAEEIRKTEQAEEDNQQVVGELIEGIVPEPKQILSKHEDLGSSTSLYIELWNAQLSGTRWVLNTSSNVKTPSSSFSSFPSEELPSEINTKHLEEYFSWIMESPSSAPSPERQEVPIQTTLCSLIFRRSNKKGFASFDELEELLGQPPVQNIVNFFELPDDYKVSRLHDRGICQVIASQKDGKPLKAYMIQTPFYGSGGFWSLVLICMTESDAPDSPSKTSAILQADQDSDPTKLYRNVQDLTKLGRHPMLVPLELFRTHCLNTSDRFRTLLADVKSVDNRLLIQLETETKPDVSRKEYRELSRILHKCNMELEELGRRRNFEEKLNKRLSEDLHGRSALSQIATMFAEISKSRDEDLANLPGKLDSQRNVLSSLIAQYDNNTSSNLAMESLRDSKAMKTLSILTILFLPGAFIATVFSTDMFEFRDAKQEIRIYFVIVVPLTFALMIGWLLWLRNTPQDGDEEAGRARYDGNKGKSD